MRPPLVAKYEQILAADPRSRIFVELARALVDAGDLPRALEVCRNGLEHHPQSIQGRIIWGRALLAGGDARGAQDQFEVAIGIDPANPYAYNLVGEAMLKGGLWREALPVLTRAAELQPADVKVKGWLEEARRGADGGTSVALPAQPAPVEVATPASDPGPAPAAAPQPASPRPAARATPSSTRTPAAPPREPSPPAAPSPTIVGLPAVGSWLDEDLPDELPLPHLPPEPAASLDDALASPAPAGHASEEQTEEFALPPGELAHEDEAEETLHLSLDAMEEDEDRTAALGSDEPAPPTEAAAPPPPRAAPTPPTLTPRKRGLPGPSTLLTMMPPTEGPSATAAGGASRSAGPAPDALEATRIALAYEQELRNRAERAAVAAESAPPPRSRALWIGLALALVVGGAVTAYLVVQSRTRTERATQALLDARAGLARDTRASLQKAAEVLAGSRAEPPGDADQKAQLDSLAAQVAAVLAADHGDEPAAALARSLSMGGREGDGALAARYLLAANPAERAAAAVAILSVGPGAGPLIHRLAGQILISRGDADSGRAQLEAAAHATPPLLGALADLGDQRLAQGDAEGALTYFEAALQGHRTHPRAALGAAEARLALERPPEGSLAELKAVEADAGSPPPRAVRLRFELTYARLLLAGGDVAGASRRLTLAAGALGDSISLQAARAGLLLSARDFAGAEEAAARAAKLEPKEPAHRILLARARLGQHRNGPAYEALAGLDSREAWLVRGEALLAAGQAEPARAALEKTVRGGKMTPEAATWYGLAELALGRTQPAVDLLAKLAAAPTAAPLQLAAHGRALAAAKQLDAAELACKRAMEKDPTSPEGPRCLGLTLLAAGRKAEAVPPLERAVKLDPADPEAARALAAARPAAPRPAPARAPGKPTTRPRR